ncbi:MAG: primosomal protein N' [Phycisphaeraceae bacterium]|nr:primosomal protein N' [Phycisphaeraceae bacterium]
MSELFDPPLVPDRFLRVAVERAVDRYPSGLLYSVPTGCEGVRTGHRVVVPLGRGNAEVPGTVVDALGPEAIAEDGVSVDRIKPMIRRSDDLPALPGELLELARWIASYYVCPIGITLANLVPAAVRKGVGTATRLLVSPHPTPPDPRPRLGSKQRAVLDVVLATPAGDLPIASDDLTEQSGVGGTATVRRLAELGLLSIEVVTVVEARARAGSGLEDREVELNPGQQAAVEAIGGHLNAGFSSHLLFGVTGSGKTEVYLRLAREVLDAGRKVLFLVPEIALTPQTTARVLARFPGAAAAVLHSGLTAAQRHREWRRTADGEATIILGARSAVFAPIPDGELGLVVVDEEHDASYKQDQAPRYHGRDAAIRRAQLADCPVVLGSATPALESWHNATKAGRSHLHRLPERAPGLSLPKIEIVDFAEERRHLERGGPRLIGPRLGGEIARTLTAGGQVILLLNRRGYANYIACPDHRCGWVMTCTDCDAGMICHQAAGTMTRERWVRCHHCDAQLRLPPTCPLCSKRTTVFGLGTQRVEEDLARLHPDLARAGAMVRVDSDAMGGADDFHDVLERFRTGEIRLLAGTQMIAKGLDFPGVRLVGVVNADTALNMPDFRAGERTFQLVSQVVGRCGRGGSAGTAIIQTFQPDAPAIRRAAEHDFEGFAERELADRDRFGLPPARRMCRIVVRDGGESAAMRLGTELADRLQTLDPGPDVEIRGPIPCSIARIAGRYRVQVETIAKDAGVASRFLARARVGGVFTGPLALGEAVAIDVDPTSLM